MAVSRPVLRYHGGKFGNHGRMADWIISNFPRHRIYVEPFGGAASVLIRKPRAYSEVYNDLWDVVVNVFQVLRDPSRARELERVLRLTPFARREFESCGDGAITSVSDPIEKARRAILRSFAGFGSAATNAEYATGFRANSNRSGTTAAHDWANYPDHIKAFTERLRGVVIENRPAIEVIQQHDEIDCLHYVDPPYPHSTRNLNAGNKAYVCEMTDDEHWQLAEVLRSVSGMVVLSGYPCDLYDRELYPDWKRVTREALADGARKRTEVLWISPNAEAAMRQQRLFR